MVSPILLYSTFALTINMVFAENTAVEARKLPLLIFHSFTAMLVILVIIKLILGIGFVAMLTALAYAFGGIKNILRFKDFKSDSDHFISGEYSHHEPIIEYDSAGPPGYSSGGFPPAGFSSGSFPGGFSSGGLSSEGLSSSGHYRRAQTLEGGRFFRDPTIDLLQSKNQEHNIHKRSTENTATPIFHRKIRSADDNCKRKLICELHAKARRNPTFAFELYFIRKKGLAKYWDHNNTKYNDCAKKYPCQKQQLTHKTSPVQNLDQRSSYDEYDDAYYNTDYEVEYTSRDYPTYDNVNRHRK